MHVSVSIDIDASADRVWDIIGPCFGRVSDWASAVSDSQPTDEPGPNGAAPTGRVCRVTAAGFDQLTEQITDYASSARRLTYRAAGGMPAFITEARNTWHAEPLQGGGTRFTMEAVVEVVGIGRLMVPFLRYYLKRIGRRTSHDLKTYAETGQVSRAKAIQVHAFQTMPLDRWVLANALFSGGCGAAMTVASGWWSRQLGDPGNAATAALGIGLISYSTILTWRSGRGVTQDVGLLISALDAAWVLGTIAVLAVYGSRFTGEGLTAAALASLVVGTLGVLQGRAAAKPDRPPTRPGRPDGSLHEASLAAS